MPRLSSNWSKRLSPCATSRTISSVQRSPTSSSARAIEQTCPSYSRFSMTGRIADLTCMMQVSSASVACSKQVTLMWEGDVMDWLASRVSRRAKTILAVAGVLAVAAGVLGVGVAKRLAPFGADGPHTESVAADRQLERAGYRQTDVVVLLRGDNPSASAGRSEVASRTRLLARDRDVASVSGFLNTGSRAFVARDGRSTYLAVGLKATDDKGQQDAAARIVTLLAGRRNVAVGGDALASQQINNQVGHDLSIAELFAFPILFALSLLFFRSL